MRMCYQTDVWQIISKAEYKMIWDKIYNDFGFQPSIDASIKPFDFKIPFDIYDLKKSMVDWDNEDVYKIIINIFVECMVEDEYMYALDWQHSCYRYNPRIRNLKDNPTFIHDENYPCGGYNAYFPEFYPNGDYFFFVAKDLSWGYLTHPWQNKIWVYGDSLILCLRKYSKQIGLVHSSQ